MKIVGIGGLPRSGKDMAAEVFMDNGYFGVSLGDIVREEARKRHVDKPDPISVKNMTETSNYLRTTYGPDFALKEAIKRYETTRGGRQYKGLVVFSVRVPLEVDFILGHGGDVLWIEADDEVRLKRALKSRREGEPEHTLADMKAHEALQQQPQPGLPEEIQMDTDYVKKHATRIITNNGNDVEAFSREVKQLLRLTG
jgi:dephospho-CoA kinase